MSDTRFNNTIFEESTIREVDFRYSVFNQCTFKNTRFINCDFSHVSFNGTQSDIMFYECIFERSKFVDIIGDLYFNDCDDDYEILQSKNDEEDRCINKIVDNEE